MIGYVGEAPCVERKVYSREMEENDGRIRTFVAMFLEKWLVGAEENIARLSLERVLHYKNGKREPVRAVKQRIMESDRRMNDNYAGCNVQLLERCTLRGEEFWTGKTVGGKIKFSRGVGLACGTMVRKRNTDRTIFICAKSGNGSEALHVSTVNFFVGGGG